MKIVKIVCRKRIFFKFGLMLPNILLKNRAALLPKVLPIFWTNVLPIKEKMSRPFGLNLLFNNVPEVQVEFKTISYTCLYLCKNKHIISIIVEHKIQLLTMYQPSSSFQNITSL